jgi:hypothetical protein
MTKGKVRVPGHFMNYGQPEAKVKVEPQKCRHCGKPVSATVGGCGICKDCIQKAKEAKNDFC